MVLNRSTRIFVHGEINFHTVIVINFHTTIMLMISLHGRDAPLQTHPKRNKRGHSVLLIAMVTLPVLTSDHQLLFTNVFQYLLLNLGFTSNVDISVQVILFHVIG